jgi:hypothetical protein
MKLESILALTALLVSIYAIVPSDRRLSIVIKVGRLDWLIILFSLIIVHYLQFYSFFSSINFVPHWGLKRWGINPHNATYLVIIITVALLYIRLKFSKISFDNISKFRDLSEELMRTDKHFILIKLIENNINDIAKIYKNDFFFSKLVKRYNPSFQTIVQEGDSAVKRYSGKIYRVKRWLSNRMPAHSYEVEIAHDLIRQILLSKKFASSLAQKRPSLAIEISTHGFHENIDFVETYIKILLEDTSSILYYEIKNNQNISSNYRYYFNESNELLYYLFNDTRIAEKLYIWKPFGDYTLSYLEMLGHSPDTDSYNYDMGSYDDEGKWKCPLFITIQFYDLMVSEALHQNIKWHMWLFYFPLFIDKIVNNYYPKNDNMNSISECPTRYAYLIYKMISSMCSWVEAIKDISPNQENVKLENENIENGNIPKSTILAICRCFKTILVSERIDTNYKNYLLESVFSLYFSLRESNEYKGYANVLKDTLIGEKQYMVQNGDRYIESIKTAFYSFDTIPYNDDHVQEFKKFIEHN